MNCIQKQQLVSFPKVRIWKPWFRHFNNHKEFHNEGTVHLFSLMALFSYANFRSNERMISGARYMEAPGQWICKLGSLPRILRVHSKRQALEQLDYYEKYGFLTYEWLDMVLVLGIVGTPYDWVVDTALPPIEFASFASVVTVLVGSLVSGSVSLIVLILVLIVAWNYIKLLFEAAERYILVGVLIYTAPVAFATGASENTSNVFSAWCRMLGGQLFLLIMNAWCLRLFTSMVGSFLANPLSV